MRAYDIIAKKRDGMSNTAEELTFLLTRYIKDEIHDDQMAAWLMAVYLNGMTEKETTDLTQVMMHSGDCLDLSAIDGVVVDKHSTGGVGDKITLVLAPIVAAAGVPVAKLSGRGLGFTGGTIDKLEAIPQLQTTLSNDVFIKQVNDIGLAIAGQTQNLAPADKKLYALRDVTATVESIPLIASSIMSKKLAAGSSKILLDVKFGQGAFVKNLGEARKLAQMMVHIGQNLNRETIAVLSSMAQPLGYAIGNALEVEEAISVLRGEGPEDVRRLCLILAGEMLCLNGKVKTAQAGERLASDMLDTGAAYQKLLQMIARQGGDVDTIIQNKLPKATCQRKIFASQNGYIHHINGQAVGTASMILGAGRERKEDAIDLTAGLRVNKKIGDAVSVGEELATLYYNESFAAKIHEAENILLNAYHIAEQKVTAPSLVAEIIKAE